MNERLRNFLAFTFELARFTLSLIVLAVVGSLILTVAAHATNKKPKDPTQEQYQNQSQSQQQDQYQASYQDVDVTTSAAATASASANNHGNSLEVNNESGPADLVLVTNNNSEPCLRVIGLAFGNREGSGMLGWPYRSKKCDFEQAADDAFAAGERDLGWFWKCQNPNLYKQFKDKGESREKASDDCLERMVGSVDTYRRLQEAEEIIALLQNERSIDQQSYRNQLQQQREDCAESNKRALESCVQK